MRHPYRELFFLLIITLVSSAHTYSCEMCGVHSGGNSISMIPQWCNHFASIQYQYNEYKTFENSGNTDASKTGASYYNKAVFLAGVRLSKSLQLLAVVPYQYNTRITVAAKNIYKGIGDITLVGTTTIFSRTNSLKQNLIAGAGVKTPTGHHDVNDSLLGLQPGTGSWDFLLYANYGVSKGNNGAIAEASYTFTLPDAAEYKFGNNLMAKLTYYYIFRSRKLQILPSGGVKYQYLLHDYVNYNKKWLDEGTGGSIMSLCIGARLQKGNTGLMLNTTLPLIQDYATGYAKAMPGFDVGLYVAF